MKETKNCVRCFKKASIWYGHVLRGKENIIAGWCRSCYKKEGFVGHYRREYKTREWDW